LVAELAPGVAVELASPLEDVIAAGHAPYRLRGVVYGTIALLALSLSLVGVYAVMAQVSSSRTHEIGVRMALGARRAQVLSWMLGSGARMVALGLAVGLLGSWASARFLRSAVPELVPAAAGGSFLSFENVGELPAAEWLAMASAPALLVVAGLVACLLPAARASSIDPVVALRRS
jgi:ABC-type lipoprotein release transport system permease subunit